MAFPTIPVLEPFGDASQPRNLSVWSANWVAMQGLTQWQTNATGATSPTPQAGNGWNVSYGPACETYCTVTVKPANTNYLALYLRLSDFGGGTIDGYECDIDPVAGTDTAKCYRLDNGAFTVLTPNPIATQEFTNGDGFGYSIIGSTHRAYRRSNGSWSQIGVDLTDATYSVAGFGGIQGDGQIDDFGIGTLIVAPDLPASYSRFPKRKLARV